MRYRDAKTLHNGDEVAVKETSQILQVLEVIVHPKRVDVCCVDGNVYSHKEIR